MPSVRNYIATLAKVASATGLTGLDQGTSPNFSWGAWVEDYKNASLTSYFWKHANNANNPVREGIYVRGEGADGRVAFAATDASASYGVTTPKRMLDAKRWTHVGVTYDGARVQFYKNGLPFYSAAVTGNPSSGGTRETVIGQDVASIRTLYHGLWDIRVFPVKVLTPAQMRRLPDPRSILSGCKQRLFYKRNWRAAGGGAVTIYDESGNNNNLTSHSTRLVCDTAGEPDWHRILYGRPAFRSNATASTPTFSLLQIAQNFMMTR